MYSLVIRFIRGLVFVALAAGWPSRGEEAAATFVRALNLNGAPVVIDGRSWEGKDAANFSIKGNVFENQAVPLKPPTDPERAKMIRSSVWGGSVQLESSKLEPGVYQVFLYVWEDNHTERFDIFVNEQLVEDDFYSGSEGQWKRLGPWRTESKEGRIKIAARGGAANLSGVEIWAGEGQVPMNAGPEFVKNPTSEQVEFFERRIRPLLVNNCYECHSAKAENLRGGLLLDSRAGIIAGGETGPVITPGFPEASLIIQAVKHVDPDLTMPPKKKLASEEIAALEEWIRMGAPDPRTEDTWAIVAARNAIDWESARQFWSFQARKDPAPPKVKRTDWPRNEIDRFILARLEQENLEPVEDAGKRALIRRATYDLTGLPPTPEEIEAFVADNSPEAFAKVVDRLLASERYGERWGRHWLDVVRYADTAGDNSDFPIPQMYRYRNWVIEAFNRDLPYDEFVRQQLAGDLLPGASEEERKQKVIATGYIANARRFGSRVVDYPQHLTIEDTIDNVGRTFLGLTVSCARCHDHKFDPIPTQDYYALYGIFHSTRYPWPGIELDQKQKDLVPLVSEKEAEAGRRVHAAKQKELDEAVSVLQEQVKGAEGEEKKALQKKLDEAKKAADRQKRTGLPFEQAYAVQEGEKIEDVRVQQKGDPSKPGDLARRGFLHVLNGGKLPEEVEGSGRAQLADWIVDPANPLPARVMANRIWLYHFGRGIVPTPNDFGKQGKPPTHPELLDWLASRFIESGWSIKQMHRRIMLSRTYQLASIPSEAAEAKDPANELLSAFPRRRLDAESIRDTLLVLGGNLEHGPAGPHPFPEQPEWRFTQHNPFKAVYETNRRSVYLMTQRIARHPYLAIFDGPDPAASTASRNVSTTPLQALYLLNDPFVHEQAKGFAERILQSTQEESKRWEFAFYSAIGRPPNSVETAEALQLLASARTHFRESGTPVERLELESWQTLARAIFRMNEFVYID